MVYAVKQGAAHGLHADSVVAGLVGAAALALFVRRQLTTPHPLIDVRLFTNRRFSGVVVTNTLTVLGPSAVLYFLSQYLQLVQGYSPLQAGLAELPAAVAAMAFGVLAGVAVRYWSQRAVLATALVAIAAAMGSLTALSPSTTYPQIGIALFVIGAGLGVAFAVANDVVIASVPPRNAGAAAGISETAYELGTALGIALLGSVIVGCVPPWRPRRCDSARRAIVRRRAQCLRPWPRRGSGDRLGPAASVSPGGVGPAQAAAAPAAPALSLLQL